METLLKLIISNYFFSHQRRGRSYHLRWRVHVDRVWNKMFTFEQSKGLASLISMFSLINLGSTLSQPPPNTLMESFSPAAVSNRHHLCWNKIHVDSSLIFIWFQYQGRWFVELYTVKPAKDFGTCLVYDISNLSSSGKKAKIDVSYRTERWLIVTRWRDINIYFFKWKNVSILKFNCI